MPAVIIQPAHGGEAIRLRNLCVNVRLLLNGA
jgi:hypothetical protein